MKNTAPVAIDKTITLNINGSRQRLRLCAARPGLPPLLVVQAGPAVPLLHEVGKFQRRLKLENDFLVALLGPTRMRQRVGGRRPKRDIGPAGR